MSAPRLLVTGAAGFVGSWIVRRAVQRNLDVHGMVRDVRSTGRLRDISDRITLHGADIRHEKDVTTLVGRLQPTYVLHAAFSPQHPGDAAGRWEMFETGVRGTVNLLEAIRGVGSVKRFVYVGSATAYGPSTTPHHPNHPLAPITFRGVCKASASLLCRQFGATTSTICSEVRLFTIYGPWEQSHRLLPQLLRAALTGKTVQLTPEPSQRNWLFAEDAAEACLACFQETSTVGVVFNGCAETVHSTHDVVEKLQKIVGRSLVGGFGYASTDQYGDPHPLGALPGETNGVDWRPRVGLEEGLRRSWAWAQTELGRQYLGCS